MRDRHFLWGMLSYPPLAEAVLGDAPLGQPARLVGHRLAGGADGGPLLQADKGSEAPGLLLENLGAEAAARLAYYLQGFGLHRQKGEVIAGGRRVDACLFAAEPGAAAPAAADRAWSLEDWAARWGTLATQAAADLLALAGQAGAAHRRYPQLLQRAASRLRAEHCHAAADGLRHQARPGDVVLEARRAPYGQFFAVEEMQLRFRRFDGQLSASVDRAVFVSCDAATVLPYDPARDRVLLIEQFRPGPYARGAAAPWLLEPIAGRVDAGESPEEAVRREAREEAGLTLGRLLPIAGYYPSPGAQSEYLYSFLGLTDLPDRLQGRLAGVVGEAEDIRSHLVSFKRLMALVAAGEAENAPLLLSALFLARHRRRLRSVT